MPQLEPLAERPEERVPLTARIAREVEPFESLHTADLEPLLDRIGDARVVLLGEATHGTSEFYRLRARITAALIERKGFDLVAVEADWPDAAQIDHHVRDVARPHPKWQAFARFPTWMWRNEETAAFVGWLRRVNRARPEAKRVGFHGLDLYSLQTSIQAVLAYLEQVDPEAARVARERYGCLSMWQSDPAAYGRAARMGTHRTCEQEVVAMLGELLKKRLEYAARDRDAFFEAERNAVVVANAEQYYRSMYYGSRASWNLRDTHMFDTLSSLLEHRGPDARAVVWAHNSHVGDASATEMGAGGQIDLGQLCREHYGSGAYLLGFGTHHGTVAAARRWGGPVEVRQVRPSHPRSYEHLCHGSGVSRFFLPLRQGDPTLVQELSVPRLVRAIGVVYLPETELQSHYFQAVLPRWFDEFVWFDESQAVRPLPVRELGGEAETWPFGE